MMRRLLILVMGVGCLATLTAYQAIAAKRCTVEAICVLDEEDVSIDTGRTHSLQDSPSNVYVIDEDDIRHSGAIDIPTLLRRIPGIEVMQMSGADINVSARGDNQPRANKMLVLLDGRSIYLDIQGEVRWKTIPVTLPEIKRIEVMKGPASALYGFNAFDGVINIITKSPEEMKGNTNGSLLQFGGGEFGTVSAAAVQSGTYGKLGYRLSAGRDQTNRWSDRNAVAFRDHKFNLQTEYPLTGNSKLKVSGGLVDVNRYDGPHVDVVQTLHVSTQGYFNAVYERPDFYLRAYWTEFHQPAVINTNPSVARFFQTNNVDGTPNLIQDWDSYNVETQHAIKFAGGNRFTYGVHYRHNAFSSNFIDHFTREDRLGLYIQDEWSATDALTAVAGVRYDMHTEINPTYSPRLALVYKLAPDHTIRAAGAVAYRPPTAFESHTNSRGLVFPLGCPSTCAVVTRTVLLGSGNLAPEEMVSYEIGYQGWFFKHRLRVRGDIFYNQLSDLIVQRRASATVNTFVNGRNAEVYGGEAGIEFLAAPWLTGFSNFSYQEISSVAQKITEFDLRSGPRFKANSGLRGEWDNGASGEAVLHYVGSTSYPINSTFFTFTTDAKAPTTKVGGYFLLNLRGAYQFWQEKAEIAVTAFNALNDRHREHPLEETIGSRVMGWLTLKY